MMASYICRQCRARLTQRLKPARPLQWQSRATFISLRTGERPAHSPPEASEPNSKLNIRKVGIGEEKTSPARRQGSGTGRYSKYSQNTGADQRLESSEVLHEADEQAPQPGASREQFEQRRDASRSGIWDIEKCLRSRDLIRAWEHFERAYPSKDCRALADPPYEEMKLLTGGTVFKKLLDLLVAEYCMGKQVPITPSQALLRYHHLDLFRFAHFNIERASGNWVSNAWRDTTRTMSFQLLPPTPIESINTEILLEELLAVVRLFFQIHSAQNQPVESTDGNWRTLPDPNHVKGILAEADVNRDITNRLQIFHPKIKGNPTITFAAVLLFQTLNGNNPAIDPPHHLKQQNEPFIRFMVPLLALGSVATIRRALASSDDFHGLSHACQNMSYDMIKAAPIDAMNMIGAGAISATEVAGHASEKAVEVEQFFLKRIARTVQEKSHVTRLERLWEEALVTYTQDGKISIPLHVYNAFLTGFLGLLSPDHSVKIWNHMIANGIKPAVSTWTAMLSGCEKAKDIDGFNTMWNRMLQAGVQPDVYAWASRIHGLMSLRQINPGLAAMDDMGRQWLAQERLTQNSPKAGKSNAETAKPVNNFPKPSVEVMNGAISAIVFVQTLNPTRKQQYVQQILQWAGQFNITPNTITYNILIQHYILMHQFTTAYKLLSQMDAEGVEADTATYTMLIRAAFTHRLQFHDLSPADQTDRVLALFRELEAGGVKLNAYVYSSVVDSLLKQYANFTAVRVVIDYMMSRNIIASPQIYTSLITHYFQQQPPNIPAVDSLWHQILSTPGTPTDKILFDRVIEGYAAIGEIGKMMAALTHMSAHGKLPGWRALSEVVRAFAEAGDWERARAIVHDVQDGEGIAKGGMTGGAHGMRDFFALVGRLRILDMPEGSYATEDMTWEQGVQWQDKGNAAAAEAFVKSKEEEQIGTTIVESDWDVRESGEAIFQHVHEMDRKPGKVQKEERGHKSENWQTEDNGSVGGIPL